jgi:hypothetical protein
VGMCGSGVLSRLDGDSKRACSSACSKPSGDLFLEVCERPSLSEGGNWKFRCSVLDLLLREP